MNKNIVTSLKEIPGNLFENLRSQTTDLSDKSFKDSCEHPYSIRICITDKSGEKGPLTLVHKSSHVGRGRFHKEILMIFDYPVSMDVFEPDYDGWFPGNNWILEILFSHDDPPYRQSTLHRKLWETGKGFWVNHFLGASYGDIAPKLISFISEQEKWVFDYLLDIQKQALEMSRAVVCRGHWQVEWYPEGDYSKELEVENY